MRRAEFQEGCSGGCALVVRQMRVARLVWERLASTTATGEDTRKFNIDNMWLGWHGKQSVAIIREA